MNPKPRKPVDTDTYKGKVAERLLALRKKSGLTAKELAEKSGIPLTTIRSWEAGIASPISEYLPQLAEALGVKPRTIVPEK